MVFGSFNALQAIGALGLIGFSLFFCYCCISCKQRQRQHRKDEYTVDHGRLLEGRDIDLDDIDGIINSGPSTGVAMFDDMDQPFVDEDFQKFTPLVAPRYMITR